MLRKFIATALLIVSLHADVEKFQVIANNVVTENSVTIATGSVVAFSPTYYITAKKVLYDRTNGTFELFGDVLILKNNNVQTKSDYAFLDLNKDDLFLKPNMFYEEKNNFWISSKDSEKKDSLISLDKAILSSCDCVEPDWSIRVSSAEYDTKDQWIDSYNTTLFFRNVPVLYTPYLGFSTDTKRRTGLLIPTLGYSDSEGGFYSQPYFIAPKDNYDIELIPQYRTKRGAGLYSYLRYADSPDSMLKIGAGYFNEHETYKQENNLRNEDHYGLDIDYTRYNLFTMKKKDVKDGLFVDINYLNDIEYKTLEDDSYEDDNEKLVESKINYIYDTPDYFLGSYLRYYIDTQKSSNSDTLQELPKLQAHTYTRPLFLDKFLYSSDIKYTNHYRESGLRADQFEVNLPLSYSFSFFDDYVNFIAKQEFNLNRYNYANGTTSFKDGTYAETNTILSLNSDLVKPYDKYLHTMNLNVDYIKSNEIKKDGNLFNLTDTSTELSPFPVDETENNIELGINQSFFDRENLGEIVNHKLKQSILYNEFDDAKFQNMENEITYNYILGSIKNRLVYNHQDEKLTESSSSFSLDYNNFYLKLGHYLSKETVNSGRENLESYQVETKYKFSDRYSMGYYTSYNMEDSIRNNQTFKFSINDACWDLDLKYIKEIEAASTTSGNPIKQDIVYLELLLKPIGGIKQEYEINKRDVN